MPRIAMAVAVGHPHHITQRGNYRQTVFENDNDFCLYLKWLVEYSRKYSLEIWAYCLMQNHVHYVAVPHEQDDMAKTFNALHMRYARHVNRQRETNGHLWQGRFFSCALDERHLFAGVRYVENNPVRAGIVTRAEDYPWSSAQNHVLRSPNPALSDCCLLLDAIQDWPEYLRQTADHALTEEIRKNTKTDRPCGGDEFQALMEAVIGRRLEALPKGRPRKTKEMGAVPVL